MNDQNGKFYSGGKSIKLREITVRITTLKREVFG
jgi:hypothetical protein